MRPPTFTQHKVVNNATPEHLDPFIIVEDLQFKGRMSEWEKGIDPSFLTFPKQIV
jgi:hypothetical protein